MLSLDAYHAEFKGRFDYEGSCDTFLPVDPEYDTHGTACASIIGGAAGNGNCAAGIAPGVTISSCVGPDSFSQISEVFLTKYENVSIMSNSWGPLPCRPKEERRRHLQECPFSKERYDSPCNICAEFSGDLTDDCKSAVGFYCLNNFEDDQSACKQTSNRDNDQIHQMFSSSYCLNLSYCFLVQVPIILTFM